MSLNLSGRIPPARKNSYHPAVSSNSTSHLHLPRAAAQHQTIGFFVITDPCSLCSITISNSTLSQTHYNNTFGSYYDGTYDITANTPAGFSFQIWSVTGGLGVANSVDNKTQLFISGSGDLTARFTAKINPTASQTLTCGTGSCNVASNATIAQTQFYLGNHTLIVTFSGPTDTVGFSNVTVPRTDVFNSDQASITVYRNGTIVPSSQVSIVSNSTDFFIYFTFTFHSGVRAAYVFFPLQPQSLPLYLGVAAVFLIAPIIVATRARFKNKRLA